MPDDDVSRRRAELAHERAILEQRRTAFWQAKVNEGRQIRQAEEQQQQLQASEKPQQKPRRPRQSQFLIEEE